MSGFERRVGNTVPSLLTAFVTSDPSLPLITHYDDATGERTELSGATLANWVAKTANLLVDGCGLGEGDVAGIPLPPHWQTAAVLLGAWSAGLTVSTASTADVLFAPAEALDGKAADRFVLGFAPMGMPMRDVPTGWVDYIAEVRGFGDHYGGPSPSPSTPALDGVSHAELVERAASRGCPRNGRVLVDAVVHPDPVDWLLGPLAARSTVVVVTHTDPTKLDAKAAGERAVKL
jgi:uncharacterized protein (TIGR03089 family)